jgi:hypothetical protein
MKYEAKRTRELNDVQKDQLARLFKRVFGSERPVDYFESKYRSVVSGYSYHGLMITDDEDIVGAFTCIPFFYRFFGETRIFAVAVDTMIDSAYRDDIFALKRMHDVSIEVMKEDGVSFVFAIPNENAYLYWKKIVNWIDIGRLNYYIFPINASRLSGYFRYFNWLSRLYAFLCTFSFCLGSETEKEKAIHKIADGKYREYRFTKEYLSIQEDEKTAYYRIVDERGARTAYIMDVFPMDRRWLHKTLKEIYAKEQGAIDVILYAGNLDYQLCNLIRVPEKHEPIPIRVSGKIIDPHQLDERVYRLEYWSINLADFDVR